MHSLSTSAITLRRCLITGNRQVSGHNATGNIALFINGSLAMESCVVAGNAAEAASTNAKFDVSSTATITNCLFTDNQARGPAFAKDATVNACTFAGNRTANLEITGSNVTLIIANSIVMSPYQAGLSHVFDTWWEGDAGGAIPGFQNAANPVGADGVWLTADDGYQLAASSPLIDTLGSTGWVPPPASDLRGLVRPQGRRTDPGAYERDQGGQAPVATSQTVAGQEDADVAVTVLGNDADSAVLTGRILSLPARGSLFPTVDGATASGPAIISGDLPFPLPDPQRRVLYRPPADANGAAYASFTVDLDDGLHTSFPASVTVNLAVVNDPPTVVQPAALLVFEDFASTAVTVAGIGCGDPEGGQTLSVTAISSDPAVLPHPLVTYASPAGTAILTLVPAPDAFGSATVSVTIRDDAGSALGGSDATTVSFPVQVYGLNDPPTFYIHHSLEFSKPGLLVRDEDSAWVTIKLRGLSSGPANESSQLLGLLATPTDAALLEVEVLSLDPATEAQVRLRPRPDRHGSAQVVLTLLDDGESSPGNNALTRTVSVLVAPINDPPTVARNLPIAVARGARAAIDRDHLLITDPDQQPEAAFFLVVDTPPAHGAIERDLVPLAAGASFTMQDISDGRITYRHDGSAPVGDLATLSFSDGLLDRPFPTVALSVAVDGRAVPLVTIPGQGPAWAEGGSAVAVAATATVSDADDAALPGGSITVSVAGDDGSAVLALADQGAGAGQVSIRGASVYYGGKALGTWSGGSAGTPLSIQLFVADATIEAVQAVVRAVTFRLAGSAPAAGARTVTVVVDDGSSGASAPAATAIAVVLRDDPPTVRTVRLGLPAGTSVEFALAADDADSATLSWALAGKGERFAASLVDAGRGRVRLTAPADSRGEDLLAVTVADGSSTVAASIPVLVTGPDDPRPLPAGEFPGEAFADEVLRVDIPWDCRQLPGARLAFAASADAPAGLVLAATGATSMRATWAVPAHEPPGHRRFAIIASDTVSGASGALPVLLPVRPRPQGSN
ncbi:MAG: hypothetical protein L6R48_09815 [Planctomycetes bacterium]|nr:hypothetical protein [Planctomycetota bacterium]